MPILDTEGNRVPDSDISNSMRSDYLNQPKIDPSGSVRVNPAHLVMLEKIGVDRTSPIRSRGETETRMNYGRLFEQSMLRGGASLINAKEPLKNAEYFNLKLRRAGYNADFNGNELNDTPKEPERRIPRFIFEPDTILYQEIEKVNVRLRLPYKECLFVQELRSASALAAPNPDTFDVYAMELSDTKFFFMFELYSIAFNVQVNQFRNKDVGGQVQYKAWLAEGPDKRLDPKDKKHTLAEVAFRSVAPVIAFLEGLSEGMYTLEREGVQVPPSQVPSPAKEGIEFKVRSLRANQPTKVSVPLGGTHASPREHHRRGYWRRSASGKKVWIGPVVVNKGKTEGKIIKDYQIMDPVK